MSERLIQVASSNPGKLAEIMQGVEIWRRETGRRLDARIELLPHFAELPPCDENAGSFPGNARKKALHYTQHSLERGGAPHALVLADDSGLVVDALGGKPGIFSARYAGPNATDAENNARLLRDLAGVKPERRTARFVCVLVLADSQGLREEFSGVAPGLILEEPRGGNGFGYDPLFLDPATGHTFAELTREEKLMRSHRGKALFEFLEWLAGMA